MTERRKKDLLRFLEAGGGIGADLLRRRNPTEMAASRSRAEAEGTLAEAAAKASGTLWQREWAATTLRALEKSSDAEDIAALADRIADIRATLRARDDLEIGPFRDRLRARAFPRDAFLAELGRRPAYEWDPFVQRLLDVDAIPARTTERPAGMVHYLPSPMDAVLALSETIAESDVFSDIGSGLGLVTMLVAWLSGARCRGVEIEPAYHERALELRDAFGFDVEYVCADARTVDYSDTTAFYLYDTFRGDILDDMIGVLAKEARARTIRVVSRGESNRVLEQVPWLSKVAELPSKLVMLQGTIG